MPRFRYPTFLWLFAIGNSLVWFFMLSGLAHLVYEHFAEDGALAPDAALAFFTLTPFVSSILAAQGAIVNLRAQYLIGRFSAPASADAALPANPWFVAVRRAVPVAAAAGLLSAVFFHLAQPGPLNAVTTTRVMGGIGAAITVVLVLTAADREFRRYQFHLGGLGRRTASVGQYVRSHLALPWGLVNGILNGFIAWILYHQGPGHSAALVSMAELRDDLVATTFLICVFTALATFPEVETDFAAGVAPPESDTTAMPRLWTRYAIAIGLAALVWLTIESVALLTGTQRVSLQLTIGIKATGGGILAALAAAQCGRWALARCASTMAVAGSGAANASRRVAMM